MKIIDDSNRVPTEADKREDELLDLTLRITALEARLEIAVKAMEHLNGFYNEFKNGEYKTPSEVQLIAEGLGTCRETLAAIREKS